MEEKREVRTFEVDYRCPKCSAGYLRPTGIVCDNNPPTYPHKCTNCDYSKVIKDHKYPYLVYEPVFDEIRMQHNNNNNNNNTVDIIHRDNKNYMEIHTGDIKVSENVEINKYRTETQEDRNNQEVTKNYINNYVKKESSK
jgi:hypothetical protein